jgi:hypothetical protein
MQDEKSGKDTSLQIQYPNPGGSGNSFYLLLAGDREIENWKGFSKLAKLEPTPGGTAPAGEITRLKSEKMKGLFFSENSRVSVQVLARDNQWRRVPLDDAAKALNIYSPDPLIEVTQLFEQDPRSQLDKTGKIEAPYLEHRDRQKIVPSDHSNQGMPGVTWFIEEGPPGVVVTEDQQIEVASQPFESAPFILFRSGNYSGKPGASGDFDRFLRIVARDLLSNVTDIRIPLYVKNRDFSVSTLESGTSRYERGP